MRLDKTYLLNRLKHAKDLFLNITFGKKSFHYSRFIMEKDIKYFFKSRNLTGRILDVGGGKKTHSLAPPDFKELISINIDETRQPTYMMDVNNRNFKLYNLKEKKVIFPNLDELNQNTRSRSAKLRYAIRTELPYAYPTEIKKNFLDILELQELKPWKLKYFIA